MIALRRLGASVRASVGIRLARLLVRNRYVADELIRLQLLEPRVFGDKRRVCVHPTAKLDNAIVNVISGAVELEAWAFCGHDVKLLTGTHDITRRQADRHAYPTEGRDIRIREGAWIGSGATVLGPCEVGAHAVVAAGSVVTRDVEPLTVVAGVPARVVRTLESDPTI